MFRISILLFSFALTACNSGGGGDSESSDVVTAANFPKCENIQTLERKYPRNNLPENMTLVTKTYGQAVLSETRASYYSLYRGWSSWWYPNRNDDLFRTNQSPLKTFDAWTHRALNRRTQAAQWHQQNVYQPRSEAWEGFCAPRAMASMIEIVPKRSVLVDGVCVSPSDIKALLTLSYETVAPSKMEQELNKKLVFGQQFLAQSDDYLNDIYPEQFLRFIQKSLGEQKRPFLMDHDKGKELWMNVVHAATVIIEDKSTDSASVRIITKMARFDYANFAEAKRASGQSQYEQTTRSYTAKLYGCWHGDNFVASSGEWTGNSKFDHPDFVVEVPTEKYDAIKSLQGSRNPELSVQAINQLRDKALQQEKAGNFCSK